MTISTEPDTHTHSQAVGEYQRGTLEKLESFACQLAFSEM